MRGNGFKKQHQRESSLAIEAGSCVRRTSCDQVHFTRSDAGVGGGYGAGHGGGGDPALEAESAMDPVDDPGKSLGPWLSDVLNGVRGGGERRGIPFELGGGPRGRVGHGGLHGPQRSGGRSGQIPRSLALRRPQRREGRRRASGAVQFRGEIPFELGGGGGVPLQEYGEPAEAPEDEGKREGGGRKKGTGAEARLRRRPRGRLQRRRGEWMRLGRGSDRGAELVLAVGFDYPTPGFDSGRGGGSGSGDSDGGIRGGAAEKDLLGSLVRGPLACLPTIQRRRSLRRGDRSGRQVWVRRLHRVHLR
eukprot:CAMPEP_0183328262 /NCGR_PEP_ID=MMETSP0160_2-20130417/84191_1 /TAXON_ID=2839 ORGANISM="Odontella Sinensis, Strain Grunow 1884" /NCGR_SAMPLE_ID=MMETSP0160_2 /ASSEMBLY_ACC=CAM_ASM_000250 /LENGTH=303 /DNA_ID=CAMNT_0025496421 /DNA_START=533 /DNA_END=1446 /DNA_ORIENTATION=-